MNKKMKQKRGWTLIELCVALIALAVLVGLSVQAIKPKKFLIGPFAYAGFYNLKQGVNAVMNKCTEEGGVGIYGCQQNTYKLPVTDDDAVTSINAAIDASNASLAPGQTPDEHVSIYTVDEILCMEIGNMFTLANNDKIHCKYNGGNGDNTDGANGTKPPKGDGKGANAGVANFQASNMVSYYYLERPWLRINKAAPSENDLTATTESYFKPIIIDVNGDKEPNKLGEDQFPLRIYIDGTIVPGSCQLYAGSSDPTANKVGEGVDGEIYPTNLYCPSRTVDIGGVEEPVTETGSWMETNYPFGYNLVRSWVPEGGATDDRESQIILRNLTYQQAACKSGRSIMVPRVTFCGDDGTDKETTISERNLKVLEKCESGTTSSICLERIARPSNPGLFRLPLL